MTTTTVTSTTRPGTLLAAITAMLIGLGTIAVAGHLQVGVLHDAAHDVRHATGFPCH